MQDLHPENSNTGSPADAARVPTEPAAIVPTFEPPASAASDPPGKEVQAASPFAANPGALSYSPHPRLGGAILWTLALMAVQLMVGLGLGIAVFLLSSSPSALTGAEVPAVIVVPVATFCTLATAVAVTGFLFRKQWRRKLALRGLDPLHAVLVLLLVAPLAVVATEVTALAAKVLPTFGDALFEAFSHQPLLLIVVSLCLLPALGEEIYFRGFLSRGLIAHYGVIGGSILASLLFAVSHVDPVHICGTFVLGLGMQVTFLTTRTLLAPLLLHFSNNAMAMASMRYPGWEAAGGANSGGFAHPPLLLLAAMATCGAIFLLFYHTRTRWFLPDGKEWSAACFLTESPPAALQARAIRGGTPATLSLVSALFVCIFLFALVSSVH